MKLKKSERDRLRALCGSVFQDDINVEMTMKDVRKINLYVDRLEDALREIESFKTKCLLGECCVVSQCRNCQAQIASHNAFVEYASIARQALEDAGDV